MNERIAALERSQGMAAPALKAPEPVPASQLEPVPPSTEAIITAPETITVPSAEISKPVEPPPSPPRKPGEWEQMLGDDWLARIGVVALIIALFSSLLAFAGWYEEFGDRASLLTSQLSITLVFLIFFGAMSLFHVIWRKAARGFDYALMFINAAAYFGISYGLMWHDLRVWMGGFTIALALFYASLAYTASRRGGEDTRISLFALAIAIVLLTVAIPVQLGDKAWTTIAWVAEGSVLMWLALTLRMPHFRNFRYAVFTIAATRLIFFDTTISMRGFNPVFNERFLAFIVSIAAMYLTAYFLWRNREEGRRTVYLVFVVAANFFTLWIIGAEVFSYSKISPTLSADLSLTKQALRCDWSLDKSYNRLANLYEDQRF